VRSVVILSFLALVTPTLARAEDKVFYGPPPAWVIVAEPPATPAPAMVEGEAKRPVGIVWADSQSRFTADGVSNYRVWRMKVETAEGLSAGGLTQEWDPATDSLTIHGVKVIRGDKVVDVLKSQKFEILRRERSLEQSMLDGRLTAVLQIADVRVGDIVELASTSTQREPVLAGRNGMVNAFSPLVPIEKARIRILWDKGEPRWRVGEDLPKAKVDLRPDGSGELMFEAANFKGPRAPDSAPVRYQTKGLIEFSQLSTWRNASAAFRPLYDKAAVLETASPLKAEIERIRQAGKTPEARATLALQLVEDEIRYVAISMNAQGFVPAAADETWRRRFGDCKGKTAMLLALLQGLGIEAKPVLVSIAGGEGLDVMLPQAAAFDHVLVVATIGGKDYWLDGTRTGDASLASLHVPDFGWGLPLTLVGSDLVRIKPPRPERPDTQHTLRIDASKGFDKDVPVELEVTIRYEDAGSAARAYLGRPKTEVQRSIIDAYDDGYRWATFKEATWRYAPEESKLVFTLKGVGTPDVRDAAGGKRYEIPGTALFASGVKLRPDDQDATAPYAVRGNGYERRQTVITLPLADADKYNLVGRAQYWRAGGVQRTRWANKARNVIYAVRSLRTVDDEISAERMAKDVADARRYQSSVIALYWTPDGKQLPKTDTHRPDGTSYTLLQRDDYVEWPESGPGSHVYSAAMSAAWTKIDRTSSPREALRVLDAAKADFAGSEEEFALLRAGLLVKLDRRPEAIAMLDQTFSPSKNTAPSRVLLMRSGAERAAGRIEAADRALAEALKIDPENPTVIEAAIPGKRQAEDYEGLLALQKKLTRLMPDEPRTWFGVGGVQSMMGRYEEALQSFDDAEETGGVPRALGRVNVLARLRRTEEANAMLDDWLAFNPNDANLLNNVCWARATGDLDLNKALGECERAVKQNDTPGNRDSLAFVKLRLGRYADAIADYDKVLSKDGEHSTSLFGRGLAKIRNGQAAAGEADLAAARKLRKNVDTEFTQYGLLPRS